MQRPSPQARTGGAEGVRGRVLGPELGQGGQGQIRWGPATDET